MLLNTPLQIYSYPNDQVTCSCSIYLLIKEIKLSVVLCLNKLLPNKDFHLQVPMKHVLVSIESFNDNLSNSEHIALYY